ncbi:MAG: Ac81 protein [Cotesia congregata filamentous virus 2]
MSSFMERKYSIENIINALKPFKMKCPPPVNSLQSFFKSNININNNDINTNVNDEKKIKLLKSFNDNDNNDNGIGNDTNDNTNKVHILKICYRNARVNSSIKHWYVEIDNIYRWHPGEKGMDSMCENPKIFTPLNMDCEEMLNPNIVSICEMCSYCTYWYMLNKINHDKRFNLFANNCELIVGYSNETILIWLTFLFTLASIMTQNLFFIILTFTFFIITIFAFTNSHPVTLKKCIHISSNIENQSIIEIQ